MFGRRKKAKKEKQEIKERSEVKPVSTSKSSEITTLIAEGCLFEGNINTTASTRIDGQVKGSVNCQNSLIVGESGYVSGEIQALEIIVFGVLEGNVKARRIEIKQGGVVNGDIVAKSFIIEDAGIYNGTCKMDTGDSVKKANSHEVQFSSSSSSDSQDADKAEAQTSS